MEMQVGGIFFVLAIIGGVALSLFLFVYWILMLINAAKREKWAWFVVMLIFGWLVALIYRVADYEPVGVRR